MKIAKWKKINEELVYDGYRKVLRKTFVLPNGKKEAFDIIFGEDAIGVVAITKHTKKIILVRQFRPGTEEAYDELPAGIIDKEETPLEAAKRELLEETGFTGDFEFVASCADCAYRTTTRYCFVARNCVKMQKPRPDKNEFIEIVEKSLDDFKKQLRLGKMTDVELAYLGLDYLKII